MAKKKIDGVIEAVRYAPDEQIAWVRAYLRRGAAFSDCALLDRKSLLDMLAQGKTFYTGRRKEYWAGSFDLGKAVRCVASNGTQFLTTRLSDVRRDELEDTPLL